VTGQFFGSNMRLRGRRSACWFSHAGRAPVMMNKLQYNVSGDGGKTHRALEPAPAGRPPHRRWTGDQMERALNFQIVNLKSRPTSCTMRPILYISGDQQLKFSDEEVAKLRQYIEGGGLIFGNADCGIAKASSKALRKGAIPQSALPKIKPPPSIYWRSLATSSSENLSC